MQSELLVRREEPTIRWMHDRPISKLETRARHARAYTTPQAGLSRDLWPLPRSLRPRMGSTCRTDLLNSRCCCLMKQVTALTADGSAILQINTTSRWRKNLARQFCKAWSSHCLKSLGSLLTHERMQTNACCNTRLGRFIPLYPDARVQRHVQLLQDSLHHNPQVYKPRSASSKNLY